MSALLGQAAWPKTCRRASNTELTALRRQLRHGDLRPVRAQVSAGCHTLAAGKDVQHAGHVRAERGPAEDGVLLVLELVPEARGGVAVHGESGGAIGERHVAAGHAGDQADSYMALA